MLRMALFAAGAAAFVAGEARAVEQPVSVADLKANIFKFRDRTVDLSGHLTVLGEVATIGVDLSDSRTVLVDLANLPRDQRRALVSKCSAGCNVHLSGKAGLVFHDVGLIAKDLRVMDDVPPKMASTAN